MEPSHKILILDDEAAWLEVSRETLAQLPSKPDIRTVNSGTRAVALLDAEPFRLLVCDLKMPKMDGLQVLTIVRRRFPELRTVVLTGLEDEEFRSRDVCPGRGFVLAEGRHAAKPANVSGLCRIPVGARHGNGLQMQMSEL